MVGVGAVLLKLKTAPLRRSEVRVGGGRDSAAVAAAGMYAVTVGGGAVSSAILPQSDADANTGTGTVRLTAPPQFATSAGTGAVSDMVAICVSARTVGIGEVSAASFVPNTAPGMGADCSNTTGFPRSYVKTVGGEAASRHPLSPQRSVAAGAVSDPPVSPQRSMGGGVVPLALITGGP